MFLPFIVSLIGGQKTLDEAVSSPLFIVFTVIMDLYPFVLMSALEEQNKTRARSKNQ
jgi:hypothetical protein